MGEAKRRKATSNRAGARLYHTTTIDKANSIMMIGFRDHATINKRLTAKYSYEPGVWFGDVPVLDDEWFDGVGLFNFDAERQAFIAVDVPHLPYAGMSFSRADSTWPGTQYWAKANVWNQFPRFLLSLDEAIKVRLSLMSPKYIRSIKEWARDRDRDYGVAFADRVRKALGTTL
jgi:hypothetical protein